MAHGNTYMTMTKERIDFTRIRTPERTFLFQYLPEKKLKQKELEKKSKQ